MPLCISRRWHLRQLIAASSLVLLVACAEKPTAADAQPLQTLPIHTSLFNRLGVAALVCALIDIAVLPLMKRLSATHSAETVIAHSGAGGGTPTIAA